jgi:hypothetical protein
MWVSSVARASALAGAQNASVGLAHAHAARRAARSCYDGSQIVMETCMNPETLARFDHEFAPRIAATIAGLFDTGVHTEVLPYQGHGHPTRIRMWAVPIEALRHYPHPLNLHLTWDSDEIERLMGEGGEARFSRYLNALPRKLDAWHNAREVDFRSHTQAEIEMLLGGLDFEA